MAVLDPSALQELAIFPLPDTVLFPGALLPLHVFEPRYRAMTEHVVEGTRLLAVARLRPGYEAEYHERPPIHPVAGVGGIVHAERLPDGRWNVMLRGLARVQLDEELPATRPWREVRARVLEDRPSRLDDEVAAVHAHLVAICDQLAVVVPDGDGLRTLARAFPTPGACADVVASVLVRDHELRQRLLETLDPADRVEQVVAAASALLLRLRPGPRRPN